MKIILCFCLTVLSLTANAKLSIATYNIRNFDYDQRSRVHTDKEALVTILTNLKADLIGISEINDTKEFTNFVATQLPDYQVKLSQCGGAHGQKLGYLYRTSKLKLLSYKEDMRTVGMNGCDVGSRPIAIMEFEEVESKTKFHALHTHLKSGGQGAAMTRRFEQYEVISEIVKELKSAGQKNFVMTGDFNTTGYLDRNLDYKKFNQMLAGTGLIALTKNTSCSAYWWGGKEDGIEYPSLLDHILISDSFLKIKDAKALTLSHCQKLACRPARLQDLGRSYEAVSDHCPLVVTPR